MVAQFKRLDSGLIFSTTNKNSSGYLIKIDKIEFPQTHGIWVENDRPPTIYNAIDLFGSLYRFEDDEECIVVGALYDKLELE